MKSYAIPRRLALLLALAVAPGCNRAGGAETVPRNDTPAGSQASQPAAQGAPVRMVVYKSPTCGCCSAWVDHVKEAGFAVEVQDMPNVTPIKNQHGLPQHLASCHTAVVDGYVVEGHVPADVIRRLLAERPQVTGIAVAGMPIGSPGMEVPGGRKDPYDVIAFSRDGSVSVFATR